jgi:hypothetical protein
MFTLCTALLATGKRFGNKPGYFPKLLPVMLSLVLLLIIPHGLLASDPPLPEVAPVDWSEISPEDVSDSRAYIPVAHQPSQSLAYYLGHFHRIANAVRDTDPNRGLIDIKVWRAAADYNPDNVDARVMENVLSLAWMYTRDEPWNPYYADPATRERLEAATMYWLSFQDEEGYFGRPDASGSNRDKALFFIKFMGEALVHLKHGPPIDPEVYQAVKEAFELTLDLTLNHEDFWEQGINFSNQYGNVFAGAAAYLTLYENEQIAQDLRRRLLMIDEHRSTAGYMSEGLGPDWGYYFGTHHSNIFMSWHYGRHLEVDGLNLGEPIREEYEANTEWLSYNAVPDGDLFYLNRAIETRQTRNHFHRIETPLSEVVSLARAFHVTREEYEDRLAWSRSQMEQEWGNPRSLITGFSGYTPYDFLFREFDVWHPTAEQRDEAFGQLPYMASDRFNHQRVDSVVGNVFTYIRRPDYYAAFNAGPSVRNRQRMGLGLIWHPELGLLFQSPSGAEGEAWGTRLPARGLHLEQSSEFPVNIKVGGEVVTPVPGASNLPDSELEIAYDMNTNFIDKRLVFGEDRIEVIINFEDVNTPRYAEDLFIEVIPLMLSAGESLAVHADTVYRVRDEKVVMAIAFSGADIIQTSQDRQEGHLRRHNVLARGTGKMSYTLLFDTEVLELPGDGTAEPVQIRTLEDLQGVGMNLTGHFILMNDLDMGNLEFAPVGDNTEGGRFSGIFDGNGYTISNLMIRREGVNTGNGLFASVDTDGIVRNLGLEGVDVIGGSNTGALVGQLYGTVVNCWSIGTVRSQTGGRVNTGGLVGTMQEGSLLDQSFSTAQVSGTNRTTGGLVGRNSGTIRDSYATGSVTAERTDPDGYAGGLVGNNEGTIVSSYATGAVSGTTPGGLAGTSSGVITDSYWDVQTTGMSAAAADGSGDLSSAFGLATAQMTGMAALEHMPGLDFELVWATSEDYPVLQWQDDQDTDTSVTPENLPQQLSLGQNWPNPFNSQTLISYMLPGQVPVRLTVYDILGRQVGILVNEIQAAGRHEVRWDASGMSSGVYVYRLEAGEKSVARNMLLVR